MRKTDKIIQRDEWEGKDVEKVEWVPEFWNSKSIIIGTFKLSKKLTDLIHYVKPASTVLLRKIEEELEVIKKSE